MLIAASRAVPLQIKFCATAHTAKGRDLRLAGLLDGGTFFMQGKLGPPPLPKMKEESAPGSLLSANSWQGKRGSGGEMRRRESTWVRCSQQSPRQRTPRDQGRKQIENEMLGGGNLSWHAQSNLSYCESPTQQQCIQGSAGDAHDLNPCNTHHILRPHLHMCA